MPHPRRVVLLAAVTLTAIASPMQTVAAQGLTPGQEAIDRLFYIVLVPAIAIGVLVGALVVYAVLKFRVRPGHTAGPVNAKTHDRKLETAWTVIPAIILLIVGVFAYQTLIKTDAFPSNPDVTVYVTAQQWAWSFKLVYSRNGTVIDNQSVLTVQVGQVVKVVLHSIDVAHSFYIPDFDLKRDVIPGHENVDSFTPLQAGNFVIHCAEFCGLRHASMLSMVHVLPCGASC